MGRRHSRITVLTANGQGNLGDELILLSEQALLERLCPNAEYTVFTYNRSASMLRQSEKIRFVPYFPNNIKRHPLKNVWYFLRNVFAIAVSDRLVVGGGGLLYDDEKGQSFKKLLQQWKLRIAIARFFRVKTVFLCLGISVKKENAPLLKPLFAGKNVVVSVRDEKSRKTLAEIGIKSQVIADPVFAWEPERLPDKRRAGTKTVGIALRRGYLLNETQTVEALIRGIIKKGYRAVLLPHSFHKTDADADDFTFLQPFAQKTGAEICGDMQSVLAEYAKLDFVIAMRLHSAILSVVHHIPFVAISYSKKTDAVLDGL